MLNPFSLKKLAETIEKFAENFDTNLQKKKKKKKKL